MRNLAKKNTVTLNLLLIAAFLLTGCAGSGDAPKKIGVLMPSKNESRWVQDSDNITRQLQAKGYHAYIKNAENNVEKQISQVEALVNDGCAVLVIAAVDGSGLADALKKAAKKKVKIIAYDRLLLDTPNVDYFASFDSFKVGAMQGGYIEKALGLENNAGPFNIEIFAGSPDDSNSQLLYDGAMSVLLPYIDAGRLVIASGETEACEVSIKGWDWLAAQARMERLLVDYYSGGRKLHAVLSPNDGLAIGIINALKGNGYGHGENFPLLTGQDCAQENVIAMLNGEQSMSVFKDTRILADRTVRMIDDLLLGKPAEINDDKTYYNGVKIVPAYMCIPIYADSENYKLVLVDSGYYDEADLKP